MHWSTKVDPTFLINVWAIVKYCKNRYFGDKPLNITINSHYFWWRIKRWIATSSLRSSSQWQWVRYVILSVAKNLYSILKTKSSGYALRMTGNIYSAQKTATARFYIFIVIARKLSDFRGNPLTMHSAKYYLFNHAENFSSPSLKFLISPQ